MTKRITPMQILERAFHEQRALGQGDPEKVCTTECRDAAVDAMQALRDYGWNVVDSIPWWINEQDRIDALAVSFAISDGKPWKTLTGWQRDKYRRQAKKMAS